MSLERSDVITAAVGILDSYGLADLSMRRVADSLGVKAGALYWHVANKQTLLAAVADEILGQLSEPSGEPLDALAGWADDLRRVLLAHRDSAELVASTQASRLGAIDPAAAPTEVLQAAGLDAELARASARALLHLVLGHVVEEQNAQALALLDLLEGEALDESGFDCAVQIFVDGLATRLH